MVLGGGAVLGWAVLGGGVVLGCIKGGQRHYDKCTMRFIDLRPVVCYGSVAWS